MSIWVRKNVLMHGVRCHGLSADGLLRYYFNLVGQDLGSNGEPGEPGNGEAPAAALEAFGRQAAIAVETAPLDEGSRRQIGNLLNSLRHGVIVTNREGTATAVNQALKSVLGPWGISVQPGQTLAGRGFGRRLEAAVHHAITTGEAHLKKQEVLGEGDNALYLCWDAVPLRREDGSVTGAIVVFEDATETVVLRRKIRDWEKLATAGEVAAGLAHELRNPLAAAIGSIQLFSLTGDEAKRQELLNKLQAELERMNTILNSFLSPARPGRKKHLRRVSLVKILEDLKFAICGEACLYDVELVVGRPPEDFPLVKGEVSGLKQVFLSIAKNAVEAMAEGGRLEIEFDRDENHAWVSFRDTGTGIPRENLEHIRRPFFTTKLAGAGLGLAVSCAIVQDLGGQLRIESEVGRGTTVQAVFPITGANPVAQTELFEQQGV